MGEPLTLGSRSRYFIHRRKCASEDLSDDGDVYVPERDDLGFKVGNHKHKHVLVERNRKGRRC